MFNFGLRFTTHKSFAEALSNVIEKKKIYQSPSLLANYISFEPKMHYYVVGA